MTGASRGLGREIALRFGRAGDRVVAAFRSGEQQAHAVVDDILAAGGMAMAVRADVANTGDVDAMAEVAVTRWGRIDVLVNNAGVAKDGLAIRIPEQQWDEVLRTNLDGPFRCMRAVSRVMMRQRTGHIISIASIAGVQGREGQANYAASKAGLIGLTKAAARELGRFNINVNAVLPGYLETAMGRAVAGDAAGRIRNENVLGRASDPEEVAEFIYRLSLMRNPSGQLFNLDSRIL